MGPRGRMGDSFVPREYWTWALNSGLTRKGRREAARGAKVSKNFAGVHNCHMWGTWMLCVPPNPHCKLFRNSPGSSGKSLSL